MLFYQQLPISCCRMVISAAQSHAHTFLTVYHHAPVASTNRSAMEAEAPSEAPLVEEVHQEEVQAVEAIPVPRECAHAY